MPLFQLILVAVIQGLTEFLPISSSGHLILLPTLTGLDDQGQLIDVAVHVGTLGAVVLYFWSDVKLAFGGFADLTRAGPSTTGKRLAKGLIVGTIPVVFVGTVLHFTGISDGLRSVKVIGWTMLIFGVALYVADQRGGSEKQFRDWSLKDALVMGLWQAVALIPGTSRSGITITTARQLGYNRQSAARLSMLMSIPTIISSGVLLGTEVAVDADISVLRDVALAAGFAFISAILALAMMMRLLRYVSFTPYVIYRVILGIGLLVYAYGW
jgi:undecaprenyl-diphosphatase